MDRLIRDVLTYSRLNRRDLELQVVSLERLVCAALNAAYPPRANSVQNWLDSRPHPPNPDPKEHAWSYMAGWYADQSCEAFYSSLWIDPQIVTQLESRLRSSGAWQIVESIAS